ncbi:MAG: isopenicillin N synthase family oxygenase [Proteobacteria bacterium]|nr:isopenicillin N synthase family oxygenase [Pseudomonadota bacterium]
MDIPIIDIAPFRDGSDPAGVARAWDAAMRATGFALIGGHGIPEPLYDGVYTHAQRFFARPLDEKAQLTFPDRGRGQGYLPIRSEIVGQVAGAAPDLCESLTFANPRFDREAAANDLDARLYRANLWPADMPGFREIVEAYIAAGRDLALTLMRLSAAALNLPADHFAPFFDRMELNLRCVLYPDQPHPPEPGALRYGPHTDFSGFTILRQDAAPGGLQVQIEGAWIDVRPVPGTLVINAGDLIQRWTNDSWISNVHRVANPPRDRTSGTRRLSIVLFTGPNSDATIECLPGCGAAKYPPIVAGLHSEERMRQTYGRTSA